MPGSVFCSSSAAFWHHCWWPLAGLSAGVANRLENIGCSRWATNIVLVLFVGILLLMAFVVMPVAWRQDQPDPRYARHVK
ncbi:hypothetical protein KIF59_08400 [Enterobacter cloacae subsp. cloacae]|nr:hypothetical protein [Enterobacter cloacae subsp. cloacae]